MATDMEDRTFQFGAFELDRFSGDLRKNGVRIKLQGQPFQILDLLLDRRGEVVTRDEIRLCLWPDNTFIDFENAISSAVWKIREALGDNSENPRFVQTMSRRGYRFLAPVSVRDRVAEVDFARREELRTVPNGTAQDQVEQAHGVTQAGGPNGLEHPISSGKDELPGKPPGLSHQGLGLQANGKINRIQRRALLWLTVAVLLPVCCIYFFLIRRPETTASYETAVSLTSEAGTQLCPSFAPDGERVVFSWDGANEDNYDIYVKQVGVDRPVRLTTDPRPDLSPAWSPDGGKIAFLRLTPSGTAEVLLTSALVGGAEQHMADVAAPIAPFRYFRFLTWSPDGRWLVLSDGHVGGDLGLFLLSVKTGAKQRLTSPPAGYDDWDPAFSPDGTHVAFVRHSGDPGDVYVLELTQQLQPRGEPRRVTFDHRPISSPAWTPDGRALLSTRYALPGRHSLWKITLSSPPRLAPLPISTDDASAVALAPKGDRLIYTRSTKNMSIWALDLPPSEPARRALAAPRLWTASSRENSNPSFSPDGCHVVFQSSRSGWYEIWLADRDGSHLQQVTELRGSVAGFPRWSPDGKRIVFHVRQQTYPSLFILEVATGRTRHVRYPAVFETMPSWSRDGKYLYSASRRSGELQIWKMPADGGPNLIQVTTHGAWNPLESADGKYVFYTKPMNPGLWGTPVSGGQEQRVFSDSIADSGLAYTPTRSGIYFFRDANNGSKETLMLYRFADKRMIPLAELSRPVGYGPDGLTRPANRALQPG